MEGVKYTGALSEAEQKRFADPRKTEEGTGLR